MIRLQQRYAPQNHILLNKASGWSNLPFSCLKIVWVGFGEWLRRNSRHCIQSNRMKVMSEFKRRSTNYAPDEYSAKLIKSINLNGTIISMARTWNHIDRSIDGKMRACVCASARPLGERIFHHTAIESILREIAVFTSLHLLTL